MQVSSQSPAAAPPSALLPVSPGGFSPQPLRACEMTPRLSACKNSSTLPPPSRIPPSCPRHPGMAPEERGGSKAAAGLPGLEKNRDESTHPTSPHLLVPPRTLARYSPILGLAGRQGAPSAPGRYLLRPAVDQEGETERERARESVRKGPGDAASNPGGRAASPALPSQSYLAHGIHSSPRSGFSPSGAFENEVRGPPPSSAAGPRARSPFSERARGARRWTAERPERARSGWVLEACACGRGALGLRGWEGPAGRAGAGQRGRWGGERAPRPGGGCDWPAAGARRWARPSRDLGVASPRARPVPLGSRANLGAVGWKKPAGTLRRMVPPPEDLGSR